MGNETDKKPNSPAANPNKEFVSEMANEIPFAKPVRKFFIREGKFIYEGLLVFGILAGLLCWYAASKGYYYGAKELESVKGQLKEAKTERDKYQLLLAPFQAMAIQVYTNVPIDKRLDYFTGQFLIFKTNLLSEIESEKPSFEFFINGQPITNHSIVSLKENRELSLAVFNKASISADQLEIDFSASPALEPTNLIYGETWHQTIPQSLTYKRMVTTNIFAHRWCWMADRSVGGGITFVSEPLAISTNMPLPVITACFDIYSSRSKMHTYYITLTFK